jgi:2-desacetyl-2-hydroxyethyl bacteriochlorophyllide A dehydrogenase
MTMNNQAVTFTAPGKAELHEAPSAPLKPGHVRIRSLRSLISTGTELTVFQGEARADSSWAKYHKYPRQVGYSNVGRIVEIGAEVAPELLGARVASALPHARFGTIEAERVSPIPSDVSDDDATFFSLAHTAMNGIRRSQLTWGESTAVVGLGLIGQLTARFVQLAGASRVFGIDSSDARVRYLPSEPHVLPLHGTPRELLPRVRGNNHGRKLDVVFEVTGNPDAIPEQVSLLRKHGRLVILGSPRGPTKEFDFHDLCNRKSYSIIGSHGFSAPPVETYNTPWSARRHHQLFFQWLEQRRVSVTPLISHHFMPSEAQQAYGLLSDRRSEAMGVIFVWE